VINSSATEYGVVMLLKQRCTSESESRPITSP